MKGQHLGLLASLLLELRARPSTAPASSTKSASSPRETKSKLFNMSRPTRAQIVAENFVPRLFDCGRQTAAKWRRLYRGELLSLPSDGAQRRRPARSTTRPNAKDEDAAATTTQKRRCRARRSPLKKRNSDALGAAAIDAQSSSSLSASTLSLGFSPPHDGCKPSDFAASFNSSSRDANCGAEISFDFSHVNAAAECTPPKNTRTGKIAPLEFLPPNMLLGESPRSAALVATAALKNGGAKVRFFLFKLL